MSTVEPDPAELDRFLRPALECVLRAARELASEHGSAGVPARVRPFLKVASVPRAGWTAIRLGAEEDDALRQAAADLALSVDPKSGSGLWLHRPDGWRVLLDAEWETWSDRQEAQRVAEAEAAAARRLERAEQTIEQLEQRVAQLDSILAATESDLIAARAQASALATERDIAVAEAAERAQERAEAVRQLKQTEERLVQRTSDLRTLELARREAPVQEVIEVPSGPTWDASAVEAALRQVVVQVGTLVEGVSALADLAGVSLDAGSTQTAGEATRRRAHRIGRGIPDDSPAAAEYLLRLPDVLVLVDGYNVAKTVWPALAVGDQRRTLERLTTSVAARTGAEMHLVFDGDGDGASAVRTAIGGVRVHFTPADIEADDEILAIVGTTSPERPVVVITDDRRVRRGSAAQGANLVGVRQFQPLLLR